MASKASDILRLSSEVKNADWPFEPPPRDFRGLVYMPRTEAEVIVLASLMLRDLGMMVYRAGDRYPDWTIFLPDDTRALVELNCEVETRSSQFKSHLGDYERCNDSCQLILCWEFDRDPTGGRVPILDLKSRFFALPKDRQREICWEGHLCGQQFGARSHAFRYSRIRAPIARRSPASGFFGLMHDPTTEIETAIVLSSLLARTDFCVERAADDFPDWTILRRVGECWIREHVELECEVGKFASHQRQMRDNPNACQRIIGWRQNAVRNPAYFPPVTLVSELLRLQPDSTVFCAGHADLLYRDDFAEIRNFLSAELSQDAGRAFLTIFDGLTGLGFVPQTDNGTLRDGISFQFVPPGMRSVNTETVNLFVYNRGRYIRPTLWWSVSSMERIDRMNPAIAMFREEMWRIRPRKGNHDITYGVHCDGDQYQQIVAPVLRLGTEARHLLWT